MSGCSASEIRLRGTDKEVGLAHLSPEASSCTPCVAGGTGAPDEGRVVEGERGTPVGGGTRPTGDGQRGSLSLSLSHNCIEEESVGAAERGVQLGGSHKRMAFVLAYEVNELCKRHGLENLGFLTLTVADYKHSLIGTIHKRFHSLQTHVLSGRYDQGVWVTERGEKRARLHLHGVVVVGVDIRSGLDFAALKNRDYRSANGALRSEWAFWRETAPKYGFGRTELLPIRSNAEGIAYYVGGYIKAAVEHRLEEDKGSRLTRFCGYGPGDRRAMAQFAWNTDRAWLWRAKVGAWARVFGLHTMEEITDRCGPRWCWLFKQQILGMRLENDIQFRGEAQRIGGDQWWRYELKREMAREEWEEKSPFHQVREYRLETGDRAAHPVARERSE